MLARKFYLDISTRSFVAGDTSTLPPRGNLFYEEDVENIELYFLRPSADPARVYDYVDYSANTVKFAVGTTTPAALQVTWSAITFSVAATITSLVTGGSGSNEQQRISLSPTPASGGWAIQLPARSVTVSSVSANVFTAANHGLYSGQSVTLTAFSLTNSSVANGGSYFVIRNGKDTFSLSSTASGTTALTASVTSGGGTVDLPAVTTGQLAYNASPASVQNALAAAGLSVNGVAQILVTGTPGTEYLLTYANGSANRDYANVSVVGSTLSGPVGLSADVNFNTAEVAALVAAGDAAAEMEIEVSNGARRQTYQTACTLSRDIIASTVSSPTPANTSFTLQSADASIWSVSIDNNGILTATKQ